MCGMAVAVFAYAAGVVAPTTPSSVCGDVSTTAALIDLAVEHQIANLRWSNTPNASVDELQVAVRAALEGNVARCRETSHSAEAAAFCDQLMGCQLLRDQAVFRAGTASCDWVEDHDFELTYYMTPSAALYYPPYNQERWSDLAPGLAGETGWGTFDHGKIRRKCSFAGPRGTWHVERVGPFRQTHMDEWHAVWWDPFNEIEATPPGHIGRTFLGTFAAAVFDDGEILAQTPVHMHHFHLYQVDRAGLKPGLTHYINTETHGDSGCQRSGLAGLCYMQLYSEGYAWPLPESFFADSNVNFVSDSKTTDGMDFFFQAAIYLPRAEAARLPFTASASANLLMNPLQKPEAGTYRTPATSEAAAWQQSTPTLGDGKILFAKWHNHHYYEDDYMVFIDISADELGLDHAPYELTRTPCGDSAESWPLSSAPDEAHGPVRCRTADSPMGQTEMLGNVLDLTANALTISGLKAHLAQNLATHRARTGEGTLLLQKGPPKAISEQHDGVWVTPKPLVRPAVGTIKKGVTIVSVVFLAPQFAVSLSEPVRMHSTVFFFVDKAGTNSEAFAASYQNGTLKRVIWEFMVHPVRVQVIMAAFLFGCLVSCWACCARRCCKGRGREAVMAAAKPAYQPKPALVPAIEDKRHLLDDLARPSSTQLSESAPLSSDASLAYT